MVGRPAGAVIGFGKAIDHPLGTVIAS